MGSGFLPGAHGRGDPRLPTVAGRTDRRGGRTRSAAADRPRPRSRQWSDGGEGRRGAARSPHPRHRRQRTDAHSRRTDARPRPDRAASRPARGSAAAPAGVRRGGPGDALRPGPLAPAVWTVAPPDLAGPAEADLFARIAEGLPAGGRFLLAHRIVPADPTDVVTPIDGVDDTPSAL